MLVQHQDCTHGAVNPPRLLQTLWLSASNKLSNKLIVIPTTKLCSAALLQAVVTTVCFAGVSLCHIPAHSLGTERAFQRSLHKKGREK